MIGQKELELLIELKKLINKYGDDTFTNLINHLRDESFLANIEMLSKKIQSIKMPQKRKKIKTNYSKKIDDLLRDIEKNNKEQSILLKNFLIKLNKKEYFKTIKELSKYLANSGIYQKNIKTWEHGKFILLSHFSKQGTSQIKENINEIEKTVDTNDRSLEGWSNIIFDEPQKG